MQGAVSQQDRVRCHIAGVVEQNVGDAMRRSSAHVVAGVQRP